MSTFQIPNLVTNGSDHVFEFKAPLYFWKVGFSQKYKSLGIARKSVCRFGLMSTFQIPNLVTNGSDHVFEFKAPLYFWKVGFSRNTNLSESRENRCVGSV